MKDVNVPIINQGVIALVIAGAATAIGIGLFKFGARRATAVLPAGTVKEIVKEVVE